MSFDEVDEQRIATMGHSQGGALRLACAALEPAIRKAVPVFPFPADYQRVREMDLAEGAYVGLKEYFRRFDPTHAREADIFERLGYIDIQHLAARIRAEVLMATSLMDQTCPPSSQFAVYNKITAPKETVLYPDFVHEDLPGISDRAFGFLCGLLSG
jgi:cephalosporin-C deacetylase